MAASITATIPVSGTMAWKQGNWFVYSTVAACLSLPNWCFRRHISHAMMMRHPVAHAMGGGQQLVAPATELQRSGTSSTAYSHPLWLFFGTACTSCISSGSIPLDMLSTTWRCCCYHCPLVCACRAPIRTCPTPACADCAIELQLPETEGEDALHPA